MKSYDETIKCVFERIEEYEAKNERKRKIVINTAAYLCCACLALLVGIGVWQGFLGGGEMPPNSSESSSGNIGISSVPPWQFTRRSFYSKEELIDWIKDGGKWEGNWGSGYYYSKYDSAYEKNLFYNAAVKNGYFPSITLKITGDYKYSYSVSADSYSHFTYTVKGDSYMEMCSLTIYVISDEHKDLPIEEKAKIFGIFGDWIPKEAIAIVSEADAVYNQYGRYIAINSYEYDDNKFELPRIIIEKGDFLIKVTAISDVEKPSEMFNYFEVAFEKVNQ